MAIFAIVKYQNGNRHEEGKLYPIFDANSENIDEITSFKIEPKHSKNQLYCLKDRCAHLGGGDWKLMETVK